MRFCALAILSGLLTFVGFISAAMVLYPGGNWIDRAAPGHRFFANFLCDLTQPVSLSGVNNQNAAFCAQLGMLCFAASLAAFFWLLPRHFAARARLASWVRGLGECAVLCLVAVSLMPSEHFGMLHARLALTAGALGLSAALCAVVGLAGSQPRLALLGGLVMLTCAFDGVLFVYHLGDVTPPPLIIPAAQKLAALLLCLWMIGVAGLSLRPGSSSGA